MDIRKQKQKISLLNFLNGLASIALALGMYGHFVEDKVPALAFLDETNITYGFMIGGVISSSLLSLAVWWETKKLNALMNQPN